MKFLLALMLFVGSVVWAEEALDPNSGAGSERDPANVSVSTPVKRTYPGGADEEDLLVQARLPDAALKTDAHSLQRDVYKSLYNQEMKEERQETPEE